MWSYNFISILYNVYLHIFLYFINITHAKDPTNYNSYKTEKYDKNNEYK